MRLALFQFIVGLYSRWFPTLFFSPFRFRRRGVATRRNNSSPDKLSPNYEGRGTQRLHVTPVTIKRTLRSFLIVEKSPRGMSSA